jgi:uncharacterized repeat protein (TIGR03803 family)
VLLSSYGALRALASFDGVNQERPSVGVATDSSGNLFGVSSGGPAGYGSVYEIARGSSSVTTVASFTATNWGPRGLTVDSSGDLFGTTINGGANSLGTVFEIAHGSQTITPLASFVGSGEVNPIGNLVLDAAGDVFGVTQYGGDLLLNNGIGVGMAFEVAHGGGVVTPVASFNDVDGELPNGSLAIDSLGNLFGTAWGGGGNGVGDAFEIVQGSGVITPLASFNGVNGKHPYGGVVVDSADDLYSATSSGGANSNGTLFEIAAGSGDITTLAPFNAANGAEPSASLVLDSAGDLFGTMFAGGVGGLGSIFEVAQGSGIVSTLASFNSAAGELPAGGVIVDSSGNFFGTTSQGGAYNYGTVFELPTSAGTSTVVTSNNSSSIFGQPVTFTATVTPSSSGETGTVQFQIDGSNAGSPVALSGNTAEYITSTLAVGSHSIAAIYSGDSNFTGSTSPIFTQSVADAATTTAVTTSNASITQGQPVTFTATVTPASGSGETGTVQFQVDGASVGSPVALTGNTAAYTTSTLAGGTHSIVAVYTGDNSFAGSTSPVLTQKILQLTTTALTSSNASPTYAQPVTFTATVTPASGSGETGTVQFQVDGSNVGSPVALSGNTAAYTTSTLTGGTHSIVAVYTGDNSFAGSTSPVLTQKILQLTTTALTSSNGSSIYGQPVTFKATVTPASGSGETGTVQFQVDGTPAGGPVSLDGNTATCITSTLNAGSHSIVAIYSGDGNFAGSASSTLSQSIAKIAVWTLSAPASFNGANGDEPNAGLVMDPAGDLFGTTAEGGGNGDGTVFEIVHGSNAITPLASFNGTDGQNPKSGVALDSAGDIFGTADVGGAYSDGTVYEIAAGSGVITALVSFNGTNGENPYLNGVVLDSAGDLFGIAHEGGSGGDGAVYEIAAGSGIITDLAAFNGTNGENAVGGVVLDSSGDLFGTTSQGGADSQGTVFELVNGSGVISTLVSFNVTDGETPHVGVVLDSSGNLYGVTYRGGPKNEGTVFEVGHATNAVTTVASFNATNGEYPSSNAVMDSSGNFFGTTTVAGTYSDGTIYEIAHGSGLVTTLASFNGGDGSDPLGNVVLDSSGDLWGTTYAGGASADGTVFELAAEGTTVTSNNPSPVYGQPVTLTATVTPNVGAGPTGTVQFQIDGSNVGSAVPLSGNTASYTTSALNAGTHSVVAVYSGDNNFASTTSAAFTQPVGQAVLALSANTMYVKLDADGQHMDTWNNATGTGAMAQSALIADFSGATYTGPATGDTFVLDFSAGNPLPTGGFSFAGGAGQNTLEIIGTSGNDTATVNGSTITVGAAFGSASIGYLAANAIIFNGDSSGSDTLIQAAQPGGGASVVFANPTAQDTLDINGGTFTMPANAIGAGTLNDTLGTVSIAAGAELVIGQSDSQADQTVFTANNLSVAGTLDITNNTLRTSELDVSLPQVTAWVQSKAITSSLVTGPHAIASRAVGYGDFAEVPASVPYPDVEVKYVPTGDTNLDGVVNTTDLTRAINDLGQPAGYSGGDILNQGIVNVNDVTAIINDLGATFNASGDSAGVADAAVQSSAGAVTPAALAHVAVTPPSAGGLVGSLFSDTRIAGDWLESAGSVLGTIEQ